MSTDAPIDLIHALPVPSCIASQLLPADAWSIIARNTIMSAVAADGWPVAYRLFYVCRAWYYGTYHNVLFWRAAIAAHPGGVERTFASRRKRSRGYLTCRLSRELDWLYSLCMPAPTKAMHALLPLH